MNISIAGADIREEHMMADGVRLIVIDDGHVEIAKIPASDDQVATQNYSVRLLVKLVSARPTLPSYELSNSASGPSAVTAPAIWPSGS